MHTNQVVHRDIKPRNILANSNCKVKLADFGLARPNLATHDDRVMWTDYVTTRWYRAPELVGCFCGTFSPAVDMWSLGCVFGELLLGRPIFPGSNSETQMDLIIEFTGKPSKADMTCVSNMRARAYIATKPESPPRDLEQMLPNVDPSARDLLRRLLAFNPAHRLSAAEALQHEFFAPMPRAGPTVPWTEPVGTDFIHDIVAAQLTGDQVRQLIYEEVLTYHPETQSVWRMMCPPPPPPQPPQQDTACELLTAAQREAVLQFNSLLMNCDLI